MSLRLIRTYRFSASHLYRRPEWSDDENRRRFGKCANLPGHGHNYRLTISVTGRLDPETGFIADLGVLDGVVARSVLDRLDHHHLNEAVEEFSSGGLVPTSENLALWIRDRLEQALPGGVRLLSVQVAEDDDLAAVWSAAGAES
jgi:6-pyruvoyltetrahydropterin/6-carboxytetrahydropterin synthase